MILRNFGDSFANRKAFINSTGFSFPVEQQLSNKSVSEKTADNSIDIDSQLYTEYYAARWMHNIGERHNGKNENKTAPHNNSQERTAG